MTLAIVFPLLHWRIFRDPAGSDMPLASILSHPLYLKGDVSKISVPFPAQRSPRHNNCCHTPRTTAVRAPGTVNPFKTESRGDPQLLEEKAPKLEVHGETSCKKKSKVQGARMLEAISGQRHELSDVSHKLLIGA